MNEFGKEYKLSEPENKQAIPKLVGRKILKEQK